MKLRVLNDLRVVQTQPAKVIKLKRFDTVEAEYDGIANFLYEGMLVDKKYFTRELKFELPEEWWTTIPDMEKIIIPENIRHRKKEIIEYFMQWFNTIHDEVNIEYLNVWEAYGVRDGRREVTDFTSEFTTQYVKFVDFFDIYYFRVLPYIYQFGFDLKPKVVQTYPDAETDDDEVKSDSILLEADNILNGDRNEQYNDPNESFKVYAEILKATFGLELTPVEICKVQMAIKLGRLKYKYKRDSLVDLCGYSEILNRLESNNDNNN